MMNLPKISIVIPSFNQGKFLEETILSIVNQQYPNLELFVIDGGSTDNSIDVIKKHEQHFTWWISEKDKGQSEAINKGFAKATGEIVSWLCSDDLLMPGSLQIVASHFLSLPENVGLIHGGAVIFESDKTIETRFTYQIPNREAYLSGMVFPQPAAFFRKSWVEKVGYLDEELHYGMDYDLFMRLALVCDFSAVDTVFARYRLHSQSKSVAESNRFITDWKKSFVNLCKNLRWTDQLEFLKKTGMYKKELSYFHTFSFIPKVEIVSAINKNKAICFQLGHVLKDLYWTGKRKDARDLMKLLRQNFPWDWLKQDQRLIIVLKKLSLPEFILVAMKKITRIFK